MEWINLSPTRSSTFSVVTLFLSDASPSPASQSTRATPRRLEMKSEKLAATNYSGEKAEGLEGPRLDRKPETTLREDVAAYGLEKVYERHLRIDLIPLPS